jgi:hypothetical protein
VLQHRSSLPTFAIWMAPDAAAWYPLIAHVDLALSLAECWLSNRREMKSEEVIRGGNSRFCRSTQDRIFARR